MNIEHRVKVERGSGERACAKFCIIMKCVCIRLSQERNFRPPGCCALRKCKSLTLLCQVIMSIRKIMHYYSYREWTFARICEEASLWATKVWSCRALGETLLETIIVQRPIPRARPFPILYNWTSNVSTIQFNSIFSADIAHSEIFSEYLALNVRLLKLSKLQ